MIEYIIGGIIFGVIGVKVYSNPRVQYFIEFGYWPSKKEWEEA